MIAGRLIPANENPGPGFVSLGRTERKEYYRRPSSKLKAAPDGFNDAAASMLNVKLPNLKVYKIRERLPGPSSFNMPI